MVLVCFVFHIPPCSGETPDNEKPIYGDTAEQELMKKEFLRNGWSPEENESHKVFRKRCKEFEEMAHEIILGVTREEEIIEWFGKSQLSQVESESGYRRKGMWIKLNPNHKVLFYQITWSSKPITVPYASGTISDINICYLTVLLDKLTTTVIDYFIEYRFIPIESID